MMDGIRTWIMSVVAVGLLVSICQGLSPNSKVQKVSRFCGGLVLFLTVLTPITQWNLSGKLQAFQDYCASLTQPEEEVAQAGNTVLEEQVCQQAQSYIQSQAAELGAEVTVTVSCTSQEGIPVPDSVSVIGEMSQSQQQCLTQCIQEGFGLGAEQIQYHTKGKT